MCDAASALFAGNVGFSLFGASQSAQGAALGGQQQAAQSLLAAQIADANARMALIEASGRMGQVDRKVDDVVGQQRAAFGAQGLDVGQGSPLLLQAFTASQGNIDKQLIAARGFAQASSFHFQALGDLEQRDQALAAARFGAGTALLGGLGGVGGALSRRFGGLNFGVASEPAPAGAGFPADFTGFGII